MIYDPDLNILNPAVFFAIVIAILREGRIDLLHLAPPCSTFSIILNTDPRTMVRSTAHPEGLPGLQGHKLEKVILGNALADSAATMLTVQDEALNLTQLEQPDRSLMRKYKPVEDALIKTGSYPYRRDSCVDGAPWKKPLVVYLKASAVGDSFKAVCQGGHDHIPLRGTAPCGRLWTRIACPYWPKWAQTNSVCWAPVLGSHVRRANWGIHQQ